MIWIVLGSVVILVLALFIHRGVRNTPFRGAGLCTPNINHLRDRETKAFQANEHKKESLW